MMQHKNKQCQNALVIYLNSKLWYKLKKIKNNNDKKTLINVTCWTPPAIITHPQGGPLPTVENTCLEKTLYFSYEKNKKWRRHETTCELCCQVLSCSSRPPPPLSPPPPSPNTHLLSEHWRLYYSNCYYRKNESVGVTGWGGNRCFHSCRWAQTNIWSRCGFSFSYLLVGIREEKKRLLLWAQVEISERTNQRCIDAWILQYFSSVTVNEHFSVVSDIHRQITCTWCQEPTLQHVSATLSPCSWVQTKCVKKTKTFIQKSFESCRIYRETNRSKV